MISLPEGVADPCTSVKPNTVYGYSDIGVYGQRYRSVQTNPIHRYIHTQATYRSCCSRRGAPPNLDGHLKREALVSWLKVLTHTALIYLIPTWQKYPGRIAPLVRDHE